MVKGFFGRAVSPWVILVAAAVMWKIVYAYWTPLMHHYLVPPGDDAAFHIGRVADAMAGKVALFTAAGYPLGFHNVVALLARLFHQSALSTIIWVGPSLLVLPIFVLYFVGKKMFDSPIVGAVAASSWAVLALAPVRAYGDGNYPNLVAGSILVPLCVAVIYQIITQKRTVKLLFAAFGLIVAIALTHHLSFIYLIVIIVPWLTLSTINNVMYPDTDKTALRYLFLAIVVIGLLGLVATVVFGHFLTPYVHALLQDGNLSGVFGRESHPLTLEAMLEIHNPFFFVIGLLGLLVLMLSPADRSLKLLIASWTLVLLALSVTAIFGLPGRFAREGAIPLAISIGYTAQAFAQYLRPLRLQAVVPIVVVAMLVASVIFGQYRPFALPDPFLPLVRVQHNEDAAFALLDQMTPAGSAILTNNSNPFISYLVHRPVYVVNSQYNVAAYLETYPIKTVYLGSKPALSDEYPYYGNYDVITRAIENAPGLVLQKRLETGSRIYLYERPK